MRFKLKNDDVRYLMHLIGCHSLYEVDNKKKIHFYEYKTKKSIKRLSKKNYIFIGEKTEIDPNLNDVLVQWMFPRKIIRDNINNKDCDAFIIINNEKLLFVEKLYDYFRIEYDDVANRNTYLLKIYKKKYKEYSFCYNIELNEEFYKNIENIDVKSFENEEDLEKFMDIKKFKKSKSDAFKVIYTSEKSSAICMILKKRKELLMYKKKESLNKEVEIFIKGGFNDIFDEMVR